jgi:hypothetical protein
MTWTAEFTTDPHRGDQLVVQIQEDNRYIAVLYREVAKVRLEFYSQSATPIPVDWLTGLIAAYRRDLELSDAARLRVPKEGIV